MSLQPTTVSPELLSHSGLQHFQAGDCTTDNFLRNCSVVGHSNDQGDHRVSAQDVTATCLAGSSCNSPSAKEVVNKVRMYVAGKVIAACAH